MEKQEENTATFIVRALFIAFIILFSLSFSNKNEKNRYEAPLHIHISILHSTNSDATIKQANRFPFCQIFKIENLSKVHFSLSNLLSKQLIDSNKTHQIYISFQKFEQVIKPMNICMFYHYLFTLNTEEPPVLS